MYLILVIIAALAALGFAAYNFFFVKKLDEGTSAMKEIAAAIREGANAFINYEYKVLYLVVAVVAAIMAVVTSWESAVALVNYDGRNGVLDVLLYGAAQVPGAVSETVALLYQVV